MQTHLMTNRKLLPTLASIFLFGSFAPNRPMHDLILFANFCRRQPFVALSLPRRRRSSNRGTRAVHSPCFPFPSFPSSLP